MSGSGTRMSAFIWRAKKAGLYRAADPCSRQGRMAQDFFTDQSWLAIDQYSYPASFSNKPASTVSFVAPQVVLPAKPPVYSLLPQFSEWSITIPCNYLEGLNNVYLCTKYKGDRITVRMQHQLIADNFNNNSAWFLELKRP